MEREFFALLKRIAEEGEKLANEDNENESICDYFSKLKGYGIESESGLSDTTGNIIDSINAEFYIKMRKKRLFFTADIDNSIRETVIHNGGELREYLRETVLTAEKRMRAGGISIECRSNDSEIIFDIVDTAERVEEKDIFDILSEMKRKFLLKKLAGKIDIETGTAGQQQRVVIPKNGMLPFKLELLLRELGVSGIDEKWPMALEALNTLPYNFAKLKKSVIREDKSETGRMIHYLKGHCGCFGINKIYIKFLEMEREQHSEWIKVKRIANEIEELIDGIDFEGIPIAFNEERKYKILIIEDNESVGILVRELLIHKGITGTIKKDALAGIEELRKQKYDIVIMDIEMPVLSGDAAIKIIRENEKLKNNYVIAMTASEPEERERLIAEGFDDVILKPIKNEILYRKIYR